MHAGYNAVQINHPILLSHLAPNFLSGVSPVNFKLAMASLLLATVCSSSLLAQDEIFPGTQPLKIEGDIASQLVDGVDRFLIRELDASVAKRVQKWPTPHGPDGKYDEAVEGLRNELKERIGMRDLRMHPTDFQVQSLASGTANSIRTKDGMVARWVRWPVFEGVDGEGLLVSPTEDVSKGIQFCAVLFCDAGKNPENLCGIGEGSSTTAFDLAVQGGLVLIPQPISRHREARNQRAKMTDQEFLYRSAFELGRHILGYQISEGLSSLDAFEKLHPKLPKLVAGWGEGGWVALHAAAVEPRFQVACISGHFGPREKVWNEPIHRNVHGLLRSFGDAQLAALIAPRSLIIDAQPGPAVDIAGEGGAPGELRGPTIEAAQSELLIAKKILSPWHAERSLTLSQPDPSNPNKTTISREGLMGAVAALGIATKKGTEVTASGSLEPSEDRRLRVIAKWDRFQQRLLDTVANERTAYWSKLDTSSIEKFQATVEPYRDHFRDEVIGSWDTPKLPPNPRTRKVYDQPKWTGYEVVLDLYPDVIAYGVLLMPKDAKEGDHRPCVVFQHGLEGRPKDVIEGDHYAYHDVAAKLAEQGYVVFAPQNLYIFEDRFRTLQRKSNPLGKTLFSTIVPQHQQIVDWLSTLSQVDSKRIAFYGLSYGGKSAMRIPALVPNYCLSICSADFNDWVWKNASTTSNYSYVWTKEYEIFEFGLGPKFNYAEMATLIAPRPFMVERGHFDGVAPDERVGLEFARVQHMYAARLKLQDRARIEWFDGPHTVNGKGTFEFLREHLNPGK